MSLETKERLATFTHSGTDGYNAVRDQGGITAYVVRAGKISVGDPVVPKD